ncbi:MAG: protein kinase [Myxococcales bacterium]|nr:protein kinase [Myxococcales bacterium]
MALACKVCDFENADGARFCSACGAALTVKKDGDALLGTTIAGKFRVEKLLGNGAMGRVYQATHVALDRGVAIKVMHDHLARSGEFATRFVREARAASKLDHPNSIRVLDFGRTDPSEGQLLYLVMELFVGSDLYGLLREEGPIDVARGARVVTQVLSALEDAHAIDLVHRDIKPENVLVGLRPDGSEIAKLCDFGIAKVAREEGPKLSQAGNMIGTPLYMSPEAAMGRDTDARSDLYSVAVVLYEVACGSRPFDAPSPLEVARLQVEEAPQPPSLRAPERRIPPALERVILKGLAKRPADRWATAREMREAIEAAILARPAGSQSEPGATRPCRACKAPVGVGARFCPACGTPQDAVPAPKVAAVGTETFAGLAGVLPDRLLGDLRRASSEARSERRTLTALCLDLIGVDDAGDPEELAGRIGERYELVTRALSRFDALVQGAGGTRLTAVFGVHSPPEAAESLVAMAVEAAFEVRRETSGARWFKGGVAAGVFLVTANAAGGPPTVLGAAAQTAARAADSARSGELLVDESIKGRVGDGYVATPARGGLFVVREDVAAVAVATAALRAVVGREAELEAFGKAVATALEGQGQVIAIRGDAGIGKTAFVREAMARNRDTKLRWYRVACRSTGGVPLGVFRDLILTYTGVGRGANADALRTLGGDRGTLAGMGLPAADQQQILGLLLASTGLRQRAGSSGPSPTESGSLPKGTPDVIAREGGAAIRNFLTAALRKGNVAFVVEDLQWIDPSSAALLAQVATAVARRPALLVLTARAGIWSDWNAPHFTRIHLGPLPAPSARRLLEGMLPDAEVPDSVAQPILQRAGGNPLFLESIVEALRSAGALSVDAGRYHLAEGAKLVAEGLRGLVEARLRSLDDGAQSVLLRAAVVGNEAEVSDLGALAGADVDVESALRILVGRGLLEERPRAEGEARKVGFANDGVREVLYEMLGPSDRKALHLALAERWDAIRAAAGDAPASLEEIARHWELAGEAGPAVARYREAAKLLLTRGEAKAAGKLLERAAQHLPKLDAGSAVGLLLELIEALAQVGDLAAVDKAIAYLDRLPLDAQAKGRAQARCERARGAVQRRAGRPAEAALVLQSALDKATAAREPELSCDLYLDLSAALEDQNETQKALQAALTGLEMASALAEKGLGDEVTLRTRLAAYLNAVGRLYLRRDDAVRAADYFRGSLAQAEKANDNAASARALANLGHIAARREDFRAAAAETMRALRLSQESGDRMSQARIHVNLGHYLVKLGRRDQAEESYRAAQTLSEAIGWSEGVAVAHQALEALARSV